MRVITM